MLHQTAKSLFHTRDEVRDLLDSIRETLDGPGCGGFVEEMLERRAMALSHQLLQIEREIEEVLG